MFTDPSFSTPQGGDLKGVNSQPLGPLPPRPSPPAASESLPGVAPPGPPPGSPPSSRLRRRFLRQDRRPKRRTPDAGSPTPTFPLIHRPLPVALAGFLPKTCPKPPQTQGNPAKPLAHHSTTTTPTTTARLARSTDVAPTRSPGQSHRARTHQPQSSHSSSRISWETV